MTKSLLSQSRKSESEKQPRGFMEPSEGADNNKLLPGKEKKNCSQIRINKTNGPTNSVFLYYHTARQYNDSLHKTSFNKKKNDDFPKKEEKKITNNSMIERNHISLSKT